MIIDPRTNLHNKQYHLVKNQLFIITEQTHAIVPLLWSVKNLDRNYV